MRECISLYYYTTRAVFSYKLRYIVGFGLVEMAISTNQKPMIYRNLYENTGAGYVYLHMYYYTAGYVIFYCYNAVIDYVYAYHRGGGGISFLFHSSCSQLYKCIN